jgi:hypothetical protein
MLQTFRAVNQVIAVRKVSLLWIGNYHGNQLAALLEIVPCTRSLRAQQSSWRCLRNVRRVSFPPQTASPTVLRESNQLKE